MLLPTWLEVALLISLIILLPYILVLAPPRHPLNVPAVPFYITLLPLFRDVDQEETYRRYLERPLREHGAVKIFFGARWNVLVARPSFVAQVFRDEDLFRKSGNHEKIPGSVLAAFLGENVISAHGAKWRLFRETVKPGLLRGFGEAERNVLAGNTGRLVGLIRLTGEFAAGRAVPVQELLQRFTIANTGQCLLDTDFKSLESDAGGLSALQTRVKREIFKPIFLSFPLLDRLPFPSRKYARQLVERFTRALQDAVEFGSVSEKPVVLGARPENSLCSLILKARDTGTWTLQQFRDNLNVLFVASQENPQIALISTLYLLAKHPAVQTKLCNEVATVEATSAELDDLPYLTATILEALRLYPPISQLVNRLTTAPAALTDATGAASVVIPPGTYVGYHSYSTNRDRGIWGADADEFRPERWGRNTDEIHALYRRVRAKGGFITFHGGRRACLGEKFALLELKIAVVALLQNMDLKLDGTPVRMMPAGPLYPRALKIVFTERQGVAAEKLGI